MTKPSPGLFETIYNTRALRRFKREPIPDDAIFQILDAAIRAPSGQNAQDWRFTVVRDPATLAAMAEWSQTPWQRYRARFGDAPIESLPRSQRLSLKSVEHLVHHLQECPLVIVVTGLKGRHGTPGGSTFPAVQNLLLAASALGIGGSVFNFPLSHEAELRARLEIPDNNQIYCIVPLGYPTDRQGPVKRKPVKDVVYLDKFGERWPYAEVQPDAGWQSRWVGEGD